MEAPNTLNVCLYNCLVKRCLKLCSAYSPQWMPGLLSLSPSLFIIDFFKELLFQARENWMGWAGCHKPWWLLIHSDDNRVFWRIKRRETRNNMDIKWRETYITQDTKSTICYFVCSQGFSVCSFSLFFPSPSLFCLSVTQVFSVRMIRFPSLLSGSSLSHLAWVGIRLGFVTPYNNVASSCSLEILQPLLFCSFLVQKNTILVIR